MPVDRSRYPDNWEEISKQIRFIRARGRCEGSPAYPACQAEHGQPHPVTGSKVMLTVGHLDHDPGNNDFDNLRAWCNRCHLTYDADFHAKNAAKTRRQKKIKAGQLELIGGKD